MATGETPIPVIDFSAFSNSNTPEREKVVDQILEAVSTVGFFYLSNHGIPQQNVDAMFDLSSRFFALPREIKSKYAYDQSTNAGWGLTERERLNFLESSLDFKEAFNMRKANGMSGNEDTLPPVLLEERDRLVEFQKSCKAVLDRLLRALAIALRIPDTEGGQEFFVRKHRFEEPSGDILRLLHYPPLPNDGGDWIRAGGHSDYGTLTLLFQQESGGLEALLRQRGEASEKFIPVPPRPGCIVVNTGDVLEFWTRGFVRSTVHRVVIPEGDAAQKSRWGGSLHHALTFLTSLIITYLPHRYSIAYFFHPNNTSTLDPIPSPLLKDLPPFKDAKTNTTAYVSADAFKDGTAMTALEHLKLRLKVSHTY
ncbi:hypothetical protein HK104_011304 [Borealophlyctis nickersoniae]|nr:hypothetical protein HK104_011304 [Borealophlyctis nickersoniae]